MNLLIAGALLYLLMNDLSVHFLPTIIRELYDYS